jgi:hypothetical protein
LAHASFIGPYAVANWTVSAPVGGGVDLSGAPNSVTLTSSNSGTGGDVDFTITAVAAALWSFDWVYWTDDSDGPTYDPAGYLLNNTFFQLSPGSGHVDVAISAGDVIGFRMSLASVRTPAMASSDRAIWPSRTSKPGKYLSRPLGL